MSESNGKKGGVLKKGKTVRITQISGKKGKLKKKGKDGKSRWIALANVEE